MALEQVDRLDEMPVMIDKQDDNGYNIAPTDKADAEAVSAAEDTAPDPASAYESLLSAKDGIIAAYEKQVESLQRQVATLIRNGAIITDSSASQPEMPDPVKIRKQNYDQFSDLGRDIGR